MEKTLLLSCRTGSLLEFKVVGKTAVVFSDREISLRLSVDWLEMKEFLFHYQLPQACRAMV